MTEHDAGQGIAGFTPSYVERKVRDVTSNDIDDATFPQLDELRLMTHDAEDCATLVRAVSTRLTLHFASWRRVFKSLLLVDYLLHTGSELFVSHLRDSIAAIRACLSYTSVEERDRDRAPAIRQAAERLESLLTDESKLAAARRAAALILGVVSTGNLRGDSELTTNSNTQARVGPPRAKTAIAKDNVYYRSFIGVPDLSHELSDLSERLGLGGFSDVHSAFWNRSGAVAKKVAVKIIRDTRDAYADKEPTFTFQARHAREISVWHEVLHENILPLYGLHWELGDLPAMVSPWCENGDIRKYLRANQNHEDIDGLKLKLLEEVLQGLRYLHEYHPAIVHADIKGANVLISNEGVACLSDFGLASVLAEHSKSFTLHTMAKGTTRWMAPELFAEDASRHTTQSDVWAVGCLLLEVQTGRAPYYHLDNETAVMRALGGRMWPSRTDDTPDRLWWLVLECCNPNPSQRPLASHVLLSLQTLRKLQADSPSTWRAQHVDVPLGCMNERLAFRLTKHMVEDSAFEDHLNSVYMDDRVWLQAVHISIGLGQLWEGASRAAAAALRICIGRLWSLARDFVEDKLAQTVAVDIIDAFLKQRIKISDTVLKIAKSPVKEVEILVNLLSQYQLMEHAKWAKAHLMTQLLVQPFYGHKSEITSLAFSPDGKFVISVDSDHVMHIFDSAKGLWSAGSRIDPTSNVVMLAVSLCARRIATVSENSGIQVWNGETGRRILNRLAYQLPITCIAISPDGNYIVTANHRNWYMWEADTGRLLQGPCDAEEKGHGLCRLGGANIPVPALAEMGPFFHRTHIASISFSCGGHRFVCVSCSGRITWWDTFGASQAPVHSGRICGLLHRAEAQCAISPDSLRLVGQCDPANRDFGVWDTGSFELLFCVPDVSNETLWTKSLTFTNNGQLIVAVHHSWCRTSIIGWDADISTGEVGIVFNIDLDEKVEVATSPANSHVAAGSTVDGTVRMLDSLDDRFTKYGSAAKRASPPPPESNGNAATPFSGGETVLHALPRVMPNPSLFSDFAEWYRDHTIGGNHMKPLPKIVVTQH